MTKKRPMLEHNARLRAELIMKVRCGLMSASQAAEQLGISRKTYYKWEQRGLGAMLGSLEDQSAGRPCQPVDSRRVALEKQLEQAQRQIDLLNHKIALQEVLSDLRMESGMDRAKKK